MRESAICCARGKCIDRLVTVAEGSLARRAILGTPRSRSTYGAWAWCCTPCLWAVSVQLSLRKQLTTDTPWDEPSTNSPEYAAYLTGQLLQYDPWTRIRGQAQSELEAVHRGAS